MTVRGEDPANTIVREIAEETGLTVEVLGPLTVQRESPRHFTIVYRAAATGGTFRPSDEVSEVLFAVLDAWPVGLREDHRALIERFARHSDDQSARVPQTRRPTVTKEIAGSPRTLPAPAGVGSGLEAHLP